jgi:hypothetical protein
MSRHLQIDKTRFACLFVSCRSPSFQRGLPSAAADDTAGVPLQAITGPNWRDIGQLPSREIRGAA